MKLNKLIAQSGIAARRTAAEMIKEGKVSVNGILCLEPWYEVQPTDRVLCDGKRVRLEPKIYLLLNKPKGVVCTVSDDKGRRTVIDLLKGYNKHRLYPVGRLDYDTTGLLLVTNDGDLAQRLLHPKFEVGKEYVATLDRAMSPEDLVRARGTIMLKDGEIKVDAISRVAGATPNTIMVSLHSGRNRIVRRFFKALGYEVRNLHRIRFGPLSLRRVSVGKVRPLMDYEIDALQQLLETAPKKQTTPKPRTTHQAKKKIGRPRVRSNAVRRVAR